MNIDKSQILELLKSQGDHDKASQADQQLPSTVDTDEHGGILSSLRLDPADLVQKLAGGALGGGGGGGLGGLLGGGR